MLLPRINESFIPGEDRNMKKHTFAIMGATGNIGHHLTEELLKKGHTVRALGRDPHKLEVLKSKGIKVHSGDSTDSAYLINAFKGCDAVFTSSPRLRCNRYGSASRRDRKSDCARDR